MAKNSKTQSPARPAPVEITQLSQLEKLSHGQPLIADILVCGQAVRLVGRRLKPAETKEVKLLLERALPPLMPPEKEGEQPRYDFRDPGYLRTSEENRRMARALALYSAFPIFRQALEQEVLADGHLGLIDQNRIVAFIENRDIEDDALEILFNLIIERIVGIAPHLGFI